jgi:hypothetical protein
MFVKDGAEIPVESFRRPANRLSPYRSIANAARSPSQHRGGVRGGPCAAASRRCG